MCNSWCYWLQPHAEHNYFKSFSPDPPVSSQDPLSAEFLLRSRGYHSITCNVHFFSKMSNVPHPTDFTLQPSSFPSLSVIASMSSSAFVNNHVLHAYVTFFNTMVLKGRHSPVSLMLWGQSVVKFASLGSPSKWQSPAGGSGTYSLFGPGKQNC